MKKNDIYNVDIVDNGMNFEGIAKIDGLTIFIDNAIIGENVNIRILKVNKSYTVAKVEKIEECSKYRQDPICEVYGRCGGCACQNINYMLTLSLKKKFVKNLLDKQNVIYGEIDNCVGMGLPYYYRNKVKYPVGIDKFDVPTLGFYSKRSHQIVKNKCCYIQDRILDMVAKEVFDKLVQLEFTIYDEVDFKGDIRQIIVRRGYHTGELMVVIVVSNKSLLSDSRFIKLVNDIIKVESKIVSVILNLNESKTNEILGEESKCIYGNEYISDNIGDYKYLISAKSFFQVNTVQTELLYNVLKAGLNLATEDILFDLYSGVGTIGIFLSKYIKMVYGIEIEKEAVDMANQNARLNNVKNVEYIAGSVEDRIVEFKNRNIQPDVIVVDPPRKGLDEKSIEYILEFEPKKIGYISCNPATLARDLKLLESKYDVIKITPIDMFPQTKHVECVCILKLK